MILCVSVNVQHVRRTNTALRVYKTASAARTATAIMCPETASANLVTRASTVLEVRTGRPLLVN